MLLVFNIYFINSFVPGLISSSQCPLFFCCFFLHPATLTLLITSFKNFRFLCCSLPSVGDSTVSTMNSPSFNIFSTSINSFITIQNYHHITNNMIYSGNINANNNTYALPSLQKSKPSSSSANLDKFSIVTAEGSGR